MILDRQHLPWALFVIIATVAAAAVYLANFHPDLLPFPFSLPAFFGPAPPLRGTVGGSPLGLIFGISAAAIFIFAALLGMRRRKPAWRIGRVQIWLKAHIWLTVLTIPLVLFHCDFSVGGPMTQTLLTLYAIVMLSGFYGLALQHFLPKLMRNEIPLETIFEQIPFIRKQLGEAAQELRKRLEPAPSPIPAAAVAAGVAATAAPESPAKTEPPDESLNILRTFLDETVLPYLAAKRGEKFQLGGQRTSDELFRALKVSVASAWHADVENLQSWCDERRQLDLQTRLQHWLHGWLFVHAPMSFLLLALTAWHAIVTLLRY